jgi:hypothetical protein
MAQNIMWGFPSSLKAAVRRHRPLHCRVGCHRLQWFGRTDGCPQVLHRPVAAVRQRRIC